MLAKRLATVIATLGLAAGLVGAFTVVKLLIVVRTDGQAILGLFVIVPIALGAIAIAAVRAESVGFMWTTIGALCGFVVIAGFSLGRFFVWEALAVLAAGCIHLDGAHPRWKFLLVPFWLLLGATALCPVLLVPEIIREGRSALSDYRYVTVSGSLLCGALLTLLSVCYLTPMLRRGLARADKRQM